MKFEGLNLRSSEENLLYVAIKSGNLLAFRKLLHTGQFTLTECDSYGRTAAHIAAGSDQSLILKEIIGKVSVDVQDEYGSTALHYAAQKGNDQCARLLLSAGFNPRLKNKERKSPTDYAFSKEGIMAELFGRWERSARKSEHAIA